MQLIGQFVQMILHWVLDFYFAHEFFALFALVVIEESGIPVPIPGDALIMLSASRAGQGGSLYPFIIIALAACAAFLGSNVLYCISWRGGRPLVDKYGKYVHLHEGRVAQLEGWLRRGGPFAIVLGRLIPGMRMPTTVMAGLAKVPYRVYAPADAVSSVVWAMVFFWAGSFIERLLRPLADILPNLLDILGALGSIWVPGLTRAIPLWWVFAALLALALAGFAIWFARRRPRRNRMPRDLGPTTVEPISGDSAA